jgi:multidrug efflux pump subunit AcrA (membrane-fusion protein)
VAVIAPKPGATNQSLVLPGTVQAWYEAPIYARVNGYIKNWYFDYGAHVKKGDLLAEIDAPDLDAQLAAAEAKLNSARATVKVRESEKQFARTTYERWRDSPKGVVSQQEQEAKEADFNSAVARVNMATAEVAADQGRGRPGAGARELQADHGAVRWCGDRARDRHRRADQCRQRHRRRQRPRAVPGRGHSRDADL